MASSSSAECGVHAEPAGVCVLPGGRVVVGGDTQVCIYRPQDGGVWRREQRIQKPAGVKYWTPRSVCSVGDTVLVGNYARGGGGVFGVRGEAAREAASLRRVLECEYVWDISATASGDRLAVRSGAFQPVIEVYELSGEGLTAGRSTARRVGQELLGGDEPCALCWSARGRLLVTGWNTVVRTDQTLTSTAWSERREDVKYSVWGLDCRADRVFVCDRRNHRVSVLSEDTGQLLRHVPVPVTAGTRLSGLAVDGDGSTLYVVDHTHSALVSLAADPHAAAAADAKKSSSTGRGIQHRGVRVQDTAVFTVHTEHTEDAGKGELKVAVTGPGKDLKEALSENQKLRMQIDLLQSERDRFKVKVEKLQSEKDSFKEKVEKLQSEKERFKVQVEQLQSETAREVKHLQAELKELKNLNEEKSKEIIHLQEALRKLEAELKESENQNQRKCEEISNQQKRIEKSEAELKKSESLNQRKCEEISNQQKTIEKSEAELKKSENLNQRKSEEIKNLHETVKKSEDQLEAQKQRYENRELRMKLELSESEKLSLQKIQQIEQLNKMIENLKIDNMKKDSELQKYKEAAAMSKREEDVLTCNRTFLVTNLRPADVLDELRECGILSQEDENMISSCEPREKQVRELIKLLPLKGPTAYPVFLSVLKEKAPFIAEKLEDIKETDITHQPKISPFVKHRTYIKENLDAEHIIDELIVEDLLTDSDKERIDSEKTKSDKVKKLLEILQLKGPDAYRIFKEVLKKDYGYMYTDLNKADQK